MFCRAMDSKRSVMEGKDDTEKECRMHLNFKNQMRICHAIVVQFTKSL